MPRTFIGGFVSLVLALACCQTVLAQGLAGSAPWDACVASPTRACILDEALLRVLSLAPVESIQLGEIAEAQASAGNIETALRVAHSIAPDQRSRVTALRAIAGVQADRGFANDATETFIEAHRLAASLPDRLNSAEALLSVAKAEAGAGMNDAANAGFAESLKLAEAVEIRAGFQCVISASPEDRVDGLLRALAVQQASAGSIAESLTTARLIKYNPQIRADTLRAIAEMRAQGGMNGAAGLILKEAVEAARATLTPPERRPSCPGMHFGPASADFYADILCTLSRAQAKAGQIEDAAATLEMALQLVPAVKDGPLWKADVSRSLVLSAIAEAQSEVGLKPQSAASFARAEQAASEVGEPRHRITALIRLARAQYHDGRANDSTRTFDEARAVARTFESAAERAGGLLNIVDAKVELGLTTDADAILGDALETTRSIPDKSKRIFLLNKIAREQLRAGHLLDGVATYAEVLDALDATDSEIQRTNALLWMIRGWPPLDTRLLAASAPQVVRIADSIAEKRRSEALVVIAKALPN